MLRRNKKIFLSLYVSTIMQRKRFVCFVFAGLLVCAFSNSWANSSSTERQCYMSATGNSYPCQIGKGGVVKNKKEGDSATPAGSFPIREIFYRPDKLTKQQIGNLIALKKKGITVRALDPDNGWSDDSRSPDYNHLISIASYTQGDARWSYEKLWRDDDVYDIVAVIGYNDDPVVKDKGSAVFMHVMRVDGQGKGMPTAGCVSLKQIDLVNVLTALTSKPIITIPERSEQMIVQ